MAHPFTKTKTAHLEKLVLYNNAATICWSSPENSESVHETQIHHDPSALASVPLSENRLIPPYHWHWYQTEHFSIVRGRFIFTLEGRDVTKSPEDGVVSVLPGQRHMFRADPAWEGEAEIVITAEPDDGLSERFFRNVYSYLDDCQRAKVEPAVPQLLLFLYSAQVSPALPGPGLLMRWVSWGLTLVVGKWFGGYVLGYKSTYPEWYDDAVAKKRI